MDKRQIDQQMDGAYVPALTLLIATLRQNQGFFAARIPSYYDRLSFLVRCGRQLLRQGKPELAQRLLVEELFRLFGVRVVVPTTRQLSILAGLMRFIIVECARQHRDLDLAGRGGVQVLINDLRQQIPAAPTSIKVDVLLVDALLSRLAEHNPHAANMLELHYFARLGLRDIALEMGMTHETVVGDMRMAKAWLISCL